MRNHVKPEDIRCESNCGNAPKVVSKSTELIMYFWGNIRLVDTSGIAFIHVPFHPQDEGDECVVACCVMVLRWARDRYGEGIPDITYDDIKGILRKETERDGLPLNAPKRLTNCKQLRKSIPRILFPYSLSTGLAEIEREIKKGFPVITWLHQKIDGFTRNHSVVVIGLSEDKMTVTYNDPLGDSRPVSVPTPNFLEEWLGTLNAQIRIHIEDEPIKKLPEYFEEEEMEEK